MRKYETTQVKLTDHAYEQYCERIKRTDREALECRCTEYLQAGEYDYDRRGFIHLKGVWWVCEVQEDTMHMITTYGKTEMDIPQALEWQARFKDRIDLANMI